MDAGPLGNDDGAQPASSTGAHMVLPDIGADAERIESAESRVLAEPEPQVSDLSASIAVLEFGAMEQALQRLLEQAGKTARDLCGMLAGLGFYPWALALAAAVAVHEINRRHSTREADHSAFSWADLAVAEES
jgi:hypothetical protein